MIRPININLNAAHPELPLVEATTFTGAPSSVFIRGVPKAVGNWSITAVSVAVTYPDNTTTARAAVESAEGVWVATIPGTATSGRTAAGFKIMADGIDENGDAVTGYVLGFADFSVLSFMPVPAPGDTFYLLRYFDQAPATPKEGDVAKIDGALKFYNGSAWEPFAAEPTIDDAVTKDSANAVKSSGIWSAIWGALAALPTGFTSLYDWCMSQLAGKASKTDATLTQHYTDWVCDPAETQGEASYFVEWGTIPETEIETWCLYIGLPGDADYVDHVDEHTPDLPNITSATFTGVDEETVTATRTASGYKLGSQSDKPLASEAEAEALRTGKQDALSAQQLANIAAVSNALAFDATHSYAAGDPVVYDGTLYTFTAAHTGAWTGSDVSAVDIIARLAGKLGNSGEQTLDGTLNILQVIGAETPIPMRIEAGRIIMDATSVGESKINIPYKYATTDTFALLSDLNGKADVSAIPYTLTTKTISNGAVSLDDRASNAVTISTTLSPNTLTINFPTATSGKVRDFAMRLNIAAGVTAPEIAWPQGVTLENDGGEVPEIADGGTGGSSTILYFSETENDGTTAKFLVKGEALTAITQA